MILSDSTIKQYILNKRIKIIPWEHSTVENILESIACASFDLQLWNYFVMYPKEEKWPLNPFVKNKKIKLEEVFVKDGEDFVIQPGQFLLSATKERLWLNDELAARVEWRSSIARLWLMIHVTWWFIDPWFGWDSPSTITLEMKNLNSVPIILRPWMSICQIAFELLNAPSEIPYNKKKTAKYNWQIKPQETLYHKWN